MTRWGVAVAAVAIAVLVVAFYLMVEGYRIVIEEAASRELEARAEVAARYLANPIGTLDFAQIRRFGEDCKRRGYGLSIQSPSGGTLFQTWADRAGESAGTWLSGFAPCGEYRVGICRPVAAVMIPYERAKRLFAFAAFIGAAGMCLFFLTLYRQRVRIRELAKVEKFRREFIADVSHEIKTPLTGILGAVDLIENGKWKMTNDEIGPNADAVGRRLLGMIGKESGRLRNLVQEILDLARLEREGEILCRVETDLSSLVKDVANRYGVTARTDGGGTSPSTPVANCDPQLIEQALVNLVENARRHSGSTDITVSLVASVSGGPVRLVVEDRGVGIPPEHLSQIFERFHRVDPARAAESGGAGLGLSIVRRIARLHGGDVTCANVLPHGARFTLTLPAYSPSADFGILRA